MQLHCSHFCTFLFFNLSSVQSPCVINCLSVFRQFCDAISINQSTILKDLNFKIFTLLLSLSNNWKLTLLFALKTVFDWKTITDWTNGKVVSVILVICNFGYLDFGYFDSYIETYDKAKIIVPTVSIYFRSKTQQNEYFKHYY